MNDCCITVLHLIVVFWYWGLLCILYRCGTLMYSSGRTKCSSNLKKALLVGAHMSSSSMASRSMF
jgi:hypothetical protein